MKRVALFLFMFFTSPLALAEVSVGTYSAFWTGLPVGKISITNDQSGGEYRFTMTLQSGGILGGNSFTTTFSSSGALRGSPVRSYIGKFSDTRKGLTRTETIQHGSGHPTFSSTPAYNIPAEFQFDLERTRGALDPAAALFALIYSAGTFDCNHSFNVYDGFSLYSASISDEGTKDLNTEFYRGPAKRCRLSVSPIAGKAAVDGSGNVPDMVVNVGQLRAGTPPMPVSGAIFVNGNRAGLRLDAFSVR